MNLIHRHIFANVFMTCAAAVALFGFVLMIGNAMKDILPYVISGQLGLDTTIRLMLLMVPFVTYYALPMGMLTGILLVLGRMSADREITALRASGVSVAWLSAPIIFLALLGVAAGVVINFQFMPLTRLAYLREKAEAVRHNPLNFIVDKTFIRDFPGVVIYASEKHGMQLRDFWIWELDGQNRVKRFARAETGRLDFDMANSKLRLTLERAQIEVRDEKDPENFSKQFPRDPGGDVMSIDLPIGKLTGETIVQKKLKWFTFTQLMTEWSRLGRADRDHPEISETDRAKQRMRVQVTIQEKFATAFSVLSFALVAIPLGIKVSRKETSANLGIGLVLTLAYYFVTIVAGWFDNHPELRPDLIIWLPNIVFQGLGLWLFYKVDRA